MHSVPKTELTDFQGPKRGAFTYLLTPVGKVLTNLFDPSVDCESDVWCYDQSPIPRTAQWV